MAIQSRGWTTYCIAVFESEIEVFDVKLQIREDELPQFKDTSMFAVRKTKRTSNALLLGSSSR